ncbi:MAG: class I SAM-dependent methyltransferase [Calditrichaceae bacterium]|nr:class I SAM-dependent methyltransferase [Calditrichaceae bacterium]
MNKLQKIKFLLKNPVKVINSGIFANQEKTLETQIFKTYKLKKLPTIDLLDLFPDINEDITTYSFLEGTSLITDIILLKKLASRFESCNYLEIGSWRGESVANISENTSQCTTINLPKDEMVKKNFKQEYINIHGFFSKNIDNVIEVYHNSRTFDFSTLKNKFDLIFIDGDHSYEGVLNDTKKTFNLRKNKKSIIAWHDYGYTTERVRYSTLKAILDGIPKSYHQNLYHVSNTLCAIYFEDCNIPTYYTQFPSIPNKKFSLNVKAIKL